jgi:H+/Cl- antiporter ClcA
MTNDTSPARKFDPKIWQVILIAIIAIVFTSVWLETYKYLDAIIWINDYVQANRWTIIVGVLVFSLLVGLCEKYLHAPNVIHGGFSESMKGEGHEGNYKLFPGTLLSSFFSLLSGASIGPEGPLAFLIMEISAWIREKLAISKDTAFGFDVAALSSAYNGIIGNPLFTAVFATEFNVGKKDALTFLAWNLIAGVTGFLIFTTLGLHSYAGFLTFPSIPEINVHYILYATILGILGAFVAMLMGIALKGTGIVMEKAFKDKPVTRILFAGSIIAGVCYFIPDLMFSGESVIDKFVENPAQFGIVMLLLMAVLKALLLAVSLKSGYLGGPLFPTLFTCTLIGLALSLAFPGVPVSIMVLCTMAAVVTLALGAPLTAILLVIVISSVNQNLVALLVLSSVVALIIGMTVRQVREKRDAGKAELPQ